MKTKTKPNKKELSDALLCIGQDSIMLVTNMGKEYVKDRQKKIKLLRDFINNYGK